ncbi:hypothetical protein B0H12DRAFT_855694 [Mycena haematopus]|nr:hypothetical protein B0H12DRAFT_855694 [Mycena haematopus]
MAFPPPERLVRLPAELLLIIVHFLCEENSIPVPYAEEYDEEKLAFPSRHLRSLSVVCRRLRDLCISPLFSQLRVTHTDQLRLLEAKCVAEPEFARLIRSVEVAVVTLGVNAVNPSQTTRSRTCLLPRGGVLPTTRLHYIWTGIPLWSRYSSYFLASSEITRMAWIEHTSD